MGACVVQVYVWVRVLPRVCASVGGCIGACELVRVFVLARVCGCVWAVCVYVCVRGRVTESESELER